MRANKECGIYCIENTINHKKYIGQSIDIKNRWCNHKNDLNKGIHDNDYLQKSWNKYGEENFEFYILEHCSRDELDEKEIYYIELYNTIDGDCGYNLKTGGQNGGSQMSEYSKSKLSESLKNYYTDEMREQKRIDALNQWSNPEIKAKITGENNGMYGRRHTDEAKKKISECNKGRISSSKINIPVLCIELNVVYESAADAMKELGLTTSILEVCYGHRKTAGGYHWKFLDKENNIS